MLRVFAGEDRLGAERAIRRILGEDYEVFEGEKLSENDLPSIFQGMTLFGGGAGEVRRILLKDLSENAAVWAKMLDYANTDHEVIIWETKIDKRSAGYKRLKELGVRVEEFALAKKPEANLVFGILDTAMRDGPAAVKMVEKIELEQEPFMFFGLMVTQAIKKFEQRAGEKEKRVLRMLAELDMQMKGEGASSEVEPWGLVKGFLLRVGEGFSK